MCTFGLNGGVPSICVTCSRARSFGQRWRHTHYVRKVTPEEFDMYEPATDSLFRTTGDQRSGAQLLADMPHDQNLTTEVCVRARVLLYSCLCELVGD